MNSKTLTRLRLESSGEQRVEAPKAKEKSEPLESMAKKEEGPKKNPPFLDMMGMRFNRLTVLKHDGCRNYYWICRCDCGKQKSIRGAYLRSGHTKSCGCFQRENRILVGTRGTRNGFSTNPETRQLFHVCRSMIARCTNPKSEAYKWYGARGIMVCDRWVKSFEDFLADMGEKPSPELSLDRIRNNGNYEPGNCRWGTDEQQCNNTRSNVLITFMRKTQTISQWAREVGLPYGTLYQRISKGWGVERAITAPHRITTKLPSEEELKKCAR